MSTCTRSSGMSALAITALVMLASSAVSAADFPAGTYTGQGFTILFDAGHYRGSQKGAVKVEGDYTANGDQVQFTDTTGPWACPAAQKGTYHWTSNGKTLTFSMMADACKERMESLTPHPWTRQ